MSSVQESSRVPNILLLSSCRCLSAHSALVGLRSRQVIHVGHFTDLGHWRSSNEVGGLGGAAHITRRSTVVLVLGVLVLPLCFLFTVQEGELLLELVEFHAKLAANGDETSQAIDVVRVLLIDLLVHLQCLIEKVHSSVAAGNHELPLDFLGLNLACSLEVLDRLLEHVLFGVVHAQARDHIDLGGIVPVTFLVEVHGLELVLLLLVQVAHLGEDFRVTWHLCDQDIVPL